MNNMRIKIIPMNVPWLLLLPILLVVSLGGCVGINSRGTPAPSVSTASHTKVFLPSITEIPSLVPIIETSTLTLTKIPTQTLIPSVVGDDSKSKVAYLLKTNGNCSLPCWWGITPGRTTWRETEHYLASLALEIPQAVYSEQDDLTYYPTRFPDPNSITPSDYIFAEIAVNGSGKIEYISTSAENHLSAMLIKMGIPSQIWINIVTIDPGAYTIVLFYDSGMMLALRERRYTGNAQFITICPDDLEGANPNLWVWDSVKYPTFASIGIFGVIPTLTRDDWFRPLGEVSDMQPQTFYDLYVNPLATQCIETPWSEWIN
jgi:hypothetical protein